MGLLLTIQLLTFPFLELVILQKGKFVSCKHQTNASKKDMTKELLETETS